MDKSDIEEAFRAMGHKEDEIPFLVSYARILQRNLNTFFPTSMTADHLSVVSMVYRMMNEKNGNPPKRK